MPNLTATQAKRNFGKMLGDVQRDPVFISKDGQQVAVLLSWDAFRRVIGRDRKTISRPDLDKLLQASIERHSSVYEALEEL
jgi:prevent-host-death family protein